MRLLCKFGGQPVIDLILDLIIRPGGVFDRARGPSVPLCIPLKGSFHLNFANHAYSYSHTLHGTARNFGEVFLGFIQPETVEVPFGPFVTVKIDAIHSERLMHSGKLRKGGHVEA
jgi:hypothetical protein